MTVDREQIRRELNRPNAYTKWTLARIGLNLLDELEQAEGEAERATYAAKELAEALNAESARLARVAPLVEAGDALSDAADGTELANAWDKAVDGFTGFRAFEGEQ